MIRFFTSKATFVKNTALVGYKKIRDDQILSGLAVTAIVAAIAKYLAPDVVWETIVAAVKSSWSWIVSTHSVYGWVILVFACMTIYAIRLSIVGYRKWLENTSEPDFVRYTSDEFYGFDWHWRWEKNRQFGEPTPTYSPNTKIVQTCPNCLGDLDASSYSHSIFQCKNYECRWEYLPPYQGIHTHNIYDVIINKIKISTRDGSYKTSIGSK